MSSKHFFKNTKKNKPVKKKNQSPSNSQTFPEFFKFSLPKVNLQRFFKTYRRSLKIFNVLIFIFAIIIVGFDLQKNIQARQKVDSERGELAKELQFWESFIAKHQDYRDAYFSISVLEYRLGNTSKAKMYVEKGLSLDPNSETGRKIEKFLVNK